MDGRRKEKGKTQRGDLAVILWRGLLREEPVPTEGYSIADIRYSRFGIEEAVKRKTKNAMGDLAVRGIFNL